MSISRVKPKIVLTYPIHPRVISQVLKPAGQVILAETPAKLSRALPQADALITLLTDRVDEKLLSRARRLRVVGNVAVGVNNIDLGACARRRIRVVNTPDVLTRATAELALTLLLSAARRVPEGERLCRSGRFKGWAPDLLLGHELHGRMAVLVGQGRIGKKAAQFFRALGVQVSFITRKDSDAQIARKLKQAQILSLHLPLTSETRHWLSARRIACLPRDAIVINTSRGPLVDEKALIRALKSKRIYAAGLDVYEHEPRIPPALRKLQNVVLLPHVGSATEETREAMARLAAEGVVGVLRGKLPWNLVKPPHG